MFVRLKYSLRELVTEATQSVHKEMRKNRSRGKMGRYRDKGTTHLPWGERSRSILDIVQG
jgi:hypothetical protein